MKKLGLGIQALADFKKHNFIYVDKTESIYKLIDEGNTIFCPVPADLVSPCWLIPSKNFWKYYAPYLSDKRETVIVGFGFNKAKRNLEDFLCEKIEKEVGN
ncbi:hypothetical protein KKHLCK_17090 [Candidatus Electrothrix laxa]